MVNVLNLISRPDRLEQFDKQSKEQGFEYRKWEGIVMPQVPFVGISRAHKAIIQDAKDRRLPKVTVCEDDCVFSSPNAFKYYWDNEPESADLYLGGCYKSLIKDRRMLFGFSALTMYTVYGRFFTDFLLMKEMNHLDRELGRFAYKYEYIVCQPMIVTQSEGWSDNRLQFENYDHLLEGIELYKG